MTVAIKAFLDRFERDAAATVLTGLVVAGYVAFRSGADLPLVAGVRGMAAAVLVAGMVGRPWAAPTSGNQVCSRRDEEATAMRAGRIIAVAVGALLTVAGFGAFVGGGAMVVADATQRDAAGYYTTSTQRLQTTTAAFVTRLDPPDRWVSDRLGTVRVQATPAAGRALFIGVASADAADAWLAGTACEQVDPAPYGPWRRHMPTMPMMRGGYHVMTPPGSQGFWAASASGPGTQVLNWPTRPGRWVVMVSNVDGAAGVAADLRAGARTGALLPFGLGLGAIGLLVLAGGVLIVMAALRRSGTPPAAARQRSPTRVPIRPASTGGSTRG